MKKLKAQTELIGIMDILHDGKLRWKVSVLGTVMINVNTLVLISNGIEYNDHITNMNSTR